LNQVGCQANLKSSFWRVAMRFRDRSEAGRLLAGALEGYKDRSDVIVLALPRGGVPVAFEVALALNVPLDLFIVRKLGVPGQEELAMGAIASGGIRTLNDRVIQQLNISSDAIDAVAAREEEELKRRERLYRGDKEAPNLSGRVVIVVDDGLATGSTMRAAVAAIRCQNPAKIVVAVPIAASETCKDLRSEADEVICAVTPEQFYAVGMWYEDFGQTSDDEVTNLLRRAA
jgi:putative phosphoribosyl transferase